MKTAIILYMPVIHRGYINFLEEYDSVFGTMYIMGPSILKAIGESHPSVIQPIARDIRALGAHEIVSAISEFCSSSLHVLEEEDISSLMQHDHFVFPEDDLSHAFIEKYHIPMEKVLLKNYFLRWDMPHSTTRNDMKVDRVVSFEDLASLDLSKYIEGAQLQALKSPDWWRQVGAVLKWKNRFALYASNTHMPSVYEVYYAGDPRANFNAGEHIEISKAIHAEAAIIASACKNGFSTRGAELFVTTFPCPACANLIALSGIERVYFVDGYSLVGAVDVLHAYGVEIVRVCP